jgi:zinc transport system substrate-binding protein
MKRFAFIAIALFIAVPLLSGCSKKEWEPEEKISIVCTIFSNYDWTRQIIGEENMDRFDLTYLISSGVDFHSFSPTMSDMVKIRTADVFIYVGGVSDHWVDEALRDANPDMIKLNLIEILGDMVIYDEYGCDHGEDEDCDEGHDHGELHLDEHICFSLRNAKKICAAIAGILSEADPENAQAYQDNMDAYTAKLSALDAEYQTAADTANHTTLVFADRFPFRYLLHDYGLRYYAAFYGCSAEASASFVTIISLASRINQLGLDVVMVTETSDQSIARTVISSTESKNQRILVLDSMKSVTSAAAENMTYLSVMENNLDVLKEALR